MLVTNEPRETTATSSNPSKETTINAILEESQTTITSQTWEATTEMKLVTSVVDVELTPITQGEVAATTEIILQEETTTEPEPQEASTSRITEDVIATTISNMEEDSTAKEQGITLIPMSPHPYADDLDYVTAVTTEASIDQNTDSFNADEDATVKEE